MTTTKQLESLVEELNDALKTPPAKKGKYVPGRYTLSWAYGGVQLQKVISEGGTIQAISPGYQTKLHLEIVIRGILTGIAMERDRNNNDRET